MAAVGRPHSRKTNGSKVGHTARRPVGPFCCNLWLAAAQKLNLEAEQEVAREWAEEKEEEGRNEEEEEKTKKKNEEAKAWWKVVKKKGKRRFERIYMDDRTWATSDPFSLVAGVEAWKRTSAEIGLKENVKKIQVAAWDEKDKEKLKEVMKDRG